LFHTRRKRVQRRPARGDNDFVVFLYRRRRRRRIIIMTLENSIPAWEVYVSEEQEEEGEEVTETRMTGTPLAKKKANRLDVSCASGHTATTHALSDDDEDCSSLYGSGGGGDCFDDELLRCTSPIFNIHASILNISTSDEDDESDENDHSYGSLLLDDSMAPPIVDSEFAPVHDDNDDESPPRAIATPVEPETSTAILVVTAKNTTNNAATAAAAAENTTTTTTTIMDRVGDFLIDGLCASASSQLEDRVCAGGAGGPTTNDQCRAGTTRPPPPSHAASAVVEQDLFQLLGCCSPTNEDEMELVNTQGILHRLFCSQHQHHHQHDDGGCTATTTLLPPHRNTVQQRCRKIQQLLRARRVPRRHHDHDHDDDAVPLRTVQSSLLYHRRHRHRRHHHNKRTTTTAKEQQQQDDYAPGYDSDPDHLVWSDQRKRTRVLAPLVVPGWTHPSRSIVPLINPADVESTMNTSWDLLWHQPTVDGQSSAPLMVHVWLERGTLIHANHMIEPRLMWRADARQCPTRSLWLLHIARIRACDDEVTSSSSSSSTLPLYAQSSTSLVIRTTATHGVDDDHRHYYFQAADPATRNEIVVQWKAAIARFAALAVLEDATSIWREFFVTNHHCDPHHPDPNSFI
jgi:hypothetical protein